MYDTMQIGSGGDTDTQTPKMRQIALRNFIGFLENPEQKFDMRTWNAHFCGGPHCIGGWAQVLFYKGNPDGVKKRLEAQVGELIGLDEDQSDALFYPHIEEGWETITSADAVKVLNHLIDHDEVDWTVAGFTPRYADSRLGRVE